MIMKYINRTIKEVVLDTMAHRSVTLVTGSRQVGKSTLCYELVKERGYNYVSLDDLNERASAIQDPQMFLQIHKSPLIIDEVQYAPGLFDAIEAIVNKEKLEKGYNAGMFVLTGSQTYELMKGVSESMAGRVGIVRMSPLSVSEVRGIEEKKFVVDPITASTRCKQNKISLDDLYGYIVQGLYPELYSDPKMNTNAFYSDYVNTYMERDVSQLINVKDKLKFQRFLEVLASLTGCELIYDNIAKIVGVKSDTIQSWISVLLAGDLIYLLEPYNEISIAKRVVKRPKIYFSDTGLACYLSRLNDKEVLKASRFSGSFVETYIINEIRKSYRNNGYEPKFYYYRDTNQHEIDLVILEGGRLSFVECKSGVSFTLKDVSSFKQLQNSAYTLSNSCIVCNSEIVYPLDKDVFVFPIGAI